MKLESLGLIKHEKRYIRKDNVIYHHNYTFREYIINEIDEILKDVIPHLNDYYICNPLTKQYSYISFEELKLFIRNKKLEFFI